MMATRMMPTTTIAPMAFHGLLRAGGSDSVPEDARSRNGGRVGAGFGADMLALVGLGA